MAKNDVVNKVFDNLNIDTLPFYDSKNGSGKNDVVNKVFDNVNTVTLLFPQENSSGKK